MSTRPFSCLRAGKRPSVFFLNINDDGGFAQLLGEVLVLAAELLHFLFLRIPLGLGTALVRGQALENAGLPFATPSGQVRGVKAFAPQ
jgi:hypothetical protein